MAREYQIDVDPLRLEEQGLTLDMLMMAVQQAGRERVSVRDLIDALGDRALNLSAQPQPQRA